MTIVSSVCFARRDLPVLATVDIVVAGGSCAGVAAAERLARAGQRVALVEPRTYLGHELSATLRPWLPADEALLAHAPLLQAFVAAQEPPPQAVHGELPISLHELKLFLEDRLLQADVELFYASAVVGMVRDGQTRGVVVANKSGRQLLECHTVIDGAENIWRFDDIQAPVFARTLEFDGVAPLEVPFLETPAELGLVDDGVRLHQGYRGTGHLLVECRMKLAADDTGLAGYAAREGEARRITTRVAAYLLQSVAAFQGATLAAASHELYGEDWRLQSSGVSLEPKQTANNTGTGDVVQFRTASPPPTPDHTSLSVDGAVVVEPESPQPGKRYRRVAVGAWEIPVVAEVDVLVVGGGTSGATAAMVAGRAGMRTALVEMNPGLGGTGTYGGVHSYWFGRRVGFAAEVTQLATHMHALLRQPPPEGAVPRWNIEAKAQALREAAEEAGVQLFLNAIVIGAVVKSGAASRQAAAVAGIENGQTARPALSVLGVAVATRQGVVALLGRVTIDATGDGDVAAHAGAQATYGAQRDHVVMWYSLAQFARPGRTRNNFTSMVDVSNVRDYTRAVVAGRHRLRERDHDHGIYVATRESRHIAGDVQLTLTDQLLHRRWPDVINVTFSNHDVKGHSASDWVQLGLIPPNLEIEIPYRALLPRGLENLLVVGKAISATHDALPAIRMQADMENLGGAAALAAANACQRGVSLRQVDVTAVQEELIEVGVLPETVRDRRLVRWQLQGEALARAIKALDARPLISYADMEMDEVYRERLLPVDICCAGPEVVPLLQAELEGERGLDEESQARRLIMAQLLALVGSPAGVPTLVRALHQALAGDELPTRSSHIRYAGAPPDQGAMPQEAYWLHALGRTRDRRALPVWQRVVDLLASASVDDIASGVKGAFYYVEAVCAGAERLGSPDAVPLLRQLHSYTPFHGLICRHGYQADFFPERRAYLELLIARALARCGSVDGAAVLVSYLEDVRALLAAHAHSELVAISGRDLGRDSAPWAQWLEAQGETLSPKPYEQRSAPMRAWHEEILVEPTNPAQAVGT